MTKLIEKIEQKKWGEREGGRRMDPMKTQMGFFILTLLIAVAMEVSEGGKYKIPDDLDDVVDDEEDEAWKQWGQKTSKKNTREFEDFKPPDFSKFSPAEIQAEMMKRHVGPAYGFVKLQLGVSRTQEEIHNIAKRWSKVLRTGSIEVKFMGVDLSTIMFTIERGQDTEELKEFILSQPEAYEVKIGELTFRRPGDPPLDEVVERLRKKRSGEGGGDTKDEL